MRPLVALLLALAPLTVGSERPDRVALEDRDGDGYPDAAELASASDRAAFLEWFALIAEAQATAPDPRWEPAQRDCAGLLRFAYRMALARHDRAFLAHTPYLPGFAPEVARFHAPGVPGLGDRLFRVTPGPFRPEAIDQDFAATATAERLVRGSARPLRAGEAPRRGDVLLYRSVALGVAHAMVYLGAGEVVYHTGPRAHPEGDRDAGEVKRATLEALRQHPDAVWHPDRSNGAFAGFFRWRIVGPGGAP